MNEYQYEPTRFMREDCHYDKQKADYAVNFIECLCHTKGIWAGKPFKLLPWQENIIRDLFGVVKPNGYRQFNTAYIEIPKKNGKQLALDTPIPTPEGFTTMGDLRVGDTVFDEKGHPCHVVAKSIPDDTEQAYRLTFRDGSSIVAGARHLWNAESIIGKPREVLWTTEQIYKHSLTLSAHSSPIRIPKVPGNAGRNCRMLCSKQKTYRQRSPQKRSRFHYLRSIEPLDHPVKMQCIQVDSESHQYLAGLSMVPTHNSELAAAVALLLCCGDGEQRAEVYGAAADRQQASIVFDVAADMIRMSPALSKRTKVLGAQKRLVFEPTNSFYQVLSSDAYTKHGFNIHGVIMDEVHIQPNRNLYDVLVRGSGDARMQPLYFLITTAGTDTNSICWELHQKAKDIMEGRKHDPTFYPVIYGADESEDWTDPEVWKKANPSLGITIPIEKAEAACLSAMENPAEENSFRQLRLDQWVKQSIRWMPMDKWDLCRGHIDLGRYYGRICYGGLDLSSTSDLTAFVLVFPPGGDDEHYTVMPFFWLPEETLELRVRRDHVNYDLWQKQGYINTTEGNVVDYRTIENFINSLNESFHICEIAYDRWNASQMVQMLQDDGFQMVPFGQGFRDMSNPTKDLMRLVLDKSLMHDGHPVLRWNMDNIFIRMDPAGNIKIDKEKSTEKVDGAVALVMALDRALKNVGGYGSIYDNRGLIIL